MSLLHKPKLAFEKFKRQVREQMGKAKHIIIQKSSLEPFKKSSAAIPEGGEVSTENESLPEEHFTTTTAATAVTMCKQNIRVIKPIGQGGFSKVYLVEDSRNRDRYAMKVVEKRRLITNGRVKDSFSEKDILANIRHPFIVHLEFTFQSESRLYFLLDYLPGGSLDMYLKRQPNRRLSEELTRFYSSELFLALQHLHFQGVVYRDLKPSNVLLDARGHICLSDMGLCKIFDEYRTSVARSVTPPSEANPILRRCTSLVGSARFVAPDVLRKTPYGPAVDWWALGVLVYMMIAGDYPFTGHDKRELYDKILHARPNFDRSPWVEPLTKDFICGLLEKHDTFRLMESQIKHHPYFQSISWESLLTKEISPPGYEPLEQSPTPANCPTTEQRPLCLVSQKPSFFNFNRKKLPLPQTPSLSTILDSLTSTSQPSKTTKKSSSATKGKTLSEAEQRLFEGFDGGRYSSSSSFSSMGYISTTGSSIISV